MTYKAIRLLIVKSRIATEWIMIVSTENTTSPKSTRSKNSDFSLQI